MGHACRIYWPGGAPKPVSPYSAPLPTAPCVSLSCWGDSALPAGTGTSFLDQVWAPFPVCWVGDVPGCAVAAWCALEQPQPTFDPVLRLGHKQSSRECLAESGPTYMPWCVPALHWMKLQCALCLCRAWNSAGGDWSLWAKGDSSYNLSSSHRSDLGHEGMGVQTQPQSCAPSGDKNCPLSFTGMDLKVRTPRDKTS